MCLYDGAYFTGLLDNNPAWTPNPGGKDDSISSIINDSDRRVRAWVDINYPADWPEFGPHQK